MPARVLANISLLKPAKYALRTSGYSADPE